MEFGVTESEPAPVSEGARNLSSGKLGVDNGYSGRLPQAEVDSSHAAFAEAGRSTA